MGPFTTVYDRYRLRLLEFRDLRVRRGVAPAPVDDEPCRSITRLSLRLPRYGVVQVTLANDLATQQLL